MTLAIAEMVLQREERAAAERAWAAQARIPAKWRRVHGQLERAASAVAALEAQAQT